MSDGVQVGVAERLENRSIAALARDHGVSRGAIRTAVADLLPEHTGVEEDIPAPELLVTLDMPGKVADFLRSADLEPVERAALDEGATVRRGQGYTLRVTAIPAVHRQLLDRCQPLDGGQGVPAVPAQRKARREYENRVSTLAPIPTMIVLSANCRTDVPRGRTLQWMNSFQKSTVACGFQGASSSTSRNSRSM
ncbi:hypothetical protein [Streptomyces phaeochromogenes]|uniref:hypothetical protein n=1 Tax=Streptomyces phaeochromogenes TaxID=1923 RepID=UPI002DD8D61B|nr:hypothetical protein [Streptomyces phaeochromogenes]WRZ36626.1 hypothetical protein OG931_52370 [Streptomyces phaeochromogenes]